jgi:hypothetical protein
MAQQGTPRPSPEEARKAIDELDLNPVIDLCKRNHGRSDADARDAEKWYRERVARGSEVRRPPGRDRIARAGSRQRRPQAHREAGVQG